MSECIRLGQDGYTGCDCDDLYTAKCKEVLDKLICIHAWLEPATSDQHGDFPQADVAACQLLAVRRLVYLPASASGKTRRPERVEHHNVRVKNDHAPPTKSPRRGS